MPARCRGEAGLACTLGVMNKSLDREALDYHSEGRKEKLEVVPSKPTATQRDLSLAYSPGVAVPCLEIEKDPLLADEYTARGNLVATRGGQRADLP